MPSLPNQMIWLTSPLIRAKQTLAWLKQSLELPDDDPVIVPELIEQNFGLWEGCSYDNISDQIDWSHAASIQPPQGERFLDMMQRVHNWMELAMDIYAGHLIVAVCHAGPIQAALAHCLKISADAALRFHPNHASLTSMTYFRQNNRWEGYVKNVNIAMIR